MLVDDTEIGKWEPSTHSGNTFSYVRTGKDVVGKLPDGPHMLRGVAEYRDGEKKTGEIPITLDAAYEDTTPIASSGAAITFSGQGYAGPKLLLAADGKRGDMRLQLQSVEGLATGDCLRAEEVATRAALAKHHAKSSVGGLFVLDAPLAQPPVVGSPRAVSA